MSTTLPSTVPVPDAQAAIVVARPEGPGAGQWAGAPSAVLSDGVFHLAYRMRRPVGAGRGFATVIARSEDGESFETVSVLHQSDFDTDSFERPALIRRPDGGWRLYVSCATKDSLHWRVDVLDANDPADFHVGQRRDLLPGDERTAVKDPVVLHDGSRWLMWLCVHEIEDPATADRMYSRFGTSTDGLDWQWHGRALEPRVGRWDSRGARIASVLLDQPTPVAYYDGRASFEENWFERTGIAVASTPGDPSSFAADGEDPVAMSPAGDGALRYLSAVALPEGGYRLFYEASCPDGSHDVRTERSGPAAADRTVNEPPSR